MKKLNIVLLCLGLLSIGELQASPQDDLVRAAWSKSMPNAANAIKAGADVNGRSSGWTPLMIAALQGNFVFAALMITKGADINFATDQGSTVLMQAVYGGNISLVELLLGDQKLSTLNAQNNEKWTALMQAAGLNQVTIVESFLKLRAKELNFGLKNNQNQTALGIALAKEDRFAYLADLLKDGAK